MAETDLVPYEPPSLNDPILGRNGSPLGYLQLAYKAMQPNNVGPWMQETFIPTAKTMGQGLMTMAGLPFRVGNAVGILPPPEFIAEAVGMNDPGPKTIGKPHLNDNLAQRIRSTIDAGALPGTEQFWAR